MTEPIRSEPVRWEIRPLRLQFDLVWSMAWNSLRVRLSRTLLTVLTVAATAAFLMFLLSMPPPRDQLEKESWQLMVGLCLLVSTAGVLNAMLMSVTQRYREIGTLKCLGALDSFVLLGTLVESGLLGLAGAAAGALAGFLCAVPFAWLQLGGEYWATLRWEAVLGHAGWALLAGCVLSFLGAFPPAILAARMPPVEAMRGEK